MGDPAFWASVVPWTIPAGILGIWALCWWGFLYPRLLVWLLAATLIAGQLIRLPLPGQGGGLLPSDIIAFILLCVLALHLVGQKIKPELILFGSLLAAFLIYALGRAFGGIGSLPAAQHFLVVFAYWVRLATYLLLIPCLMQAASRNQALAVTIRKSFLTAVTCLALMGIMQFFLIPNLAALQLSGWDPHEQRLVSTWLDPNLLGLLFVITIPFVTTQYIKTKQNKIGKAGMLKPGFGSRALTSLTY
ncbi:MAG: hypothetical protein HYZ63_02040, partial [Candidatus Andersenbacteria bacterium]|nr:hypothetical protein [Candidatus Andersenbacteria bacterium]